MAHQEDWFPMNSKNIARLSLSRLCFLPLLLVVACGGGDGSTTSDSTEMGTGGASEVGGESSTGGVAIVQAGGAAGAVVPTGAGGSGGQGAGGEPVAVTGGAPGAGGFTNGAGGAPVTRHWACNLASPGVSNSCVCSREPFNDVLPTADQSCAAATCCYLMGNDACVCDSKARSECAAEAAQASTPNFPTMVVSSCPSGTQINNTATGGTTGSGGSPGGTTGAGGSVSVGGAGGAFPNCPPVFPSCSKDPSANIAVGGCCFVGVPNGCTCLSGQEIGAMGCSTCGSCVAYVGAKSTFSASLCLAAP